MCIIIHKPEPGVLDEGILDAAEFMNQDGFGITFLDELRTHRTMDYRKARKWVESDRPFVAHYRYATRGQVNKASCHPYPFTGGWLYSNGTVESLGDNNVCDTEVVARYLATVPREYWPQLLSMTPTRFCIVLKDGTVERFGNWFERDGVFYSKDSCFPRPVPRTWSGSSAKAPWTDSYTRTRADQWEPETRDYGYIDEEEGRIVPDTLGGDTYDRWIHDVDDTYGGDTDYPDMTPLEEYIQETVEQEQDALDGWQGIHLLAVYGTLKRKHGNHGKLYGSPYLGKGHTVDRLRMVAGGIPYVYRWEHQQGHHVEVELYHVPDERVRESIDRLEGHPNWYQRHLTEIEMEENGEVVWAWLYYMGGEPARGSKFVSSF